MQESEHTILCVDDEKNILNSLKRLLRKESYKVLTASGGSDGLKLLKENEVHLVLSDQRMPEMNGTDFMAMVKKGYPDIIRIILTGYTDVDSITESINKGNVYKFFLKPWDDQNLKLEIRQALEQYNLIQANKKLHEKVIKQNEELQRINENLEDMVKERTKDLEVQNKALELSRHILEDLPVPIIGVSSEEMIVITNRAAHSMNNGKNIELGKELSDYFPNDVSKKLADALSSGKTQKLTGCILSGKSYDINLTPLAGMFKGRGAVLTLKPPKEQPCGSNC